MKTNLKNSLVLGILILTFAATNGCKKEEDENNTPKTPDFGVLADAALGENIFGDVFSQSNNAVNEAEEQTSNKAGKAHKSNCPTLTISPFDLTWPKNITVDFGPTNCVGSDGRSRRGIINIHATEAWRMPGAVTTITFDDYYIDNHKVEGTKIITNNGRNIDSNLVYTVDVQNAKVTKPDNTFLTWESLRQHEWIEGEATILNPYDDGYLITGDYAGISSGGENYTIDIISALYIHMSCAWIKAGIIDVNIDGVSTIRVDYGDGSCNPNANVIYEGITYPIVMQ